MLPTPDEEYQAGPDWLALGDGVLFALSVLRSHKLHEACAVLGVRRPSDLHPMLLEAHRIVSTETRRLEHERRCREAHEQRQRAKRAKT
jgi:hypothetical protein